jgi:hypothetical protein
MGTVGEAAVNPEKEWGNTIETALYVPRIYFLSADRFTLFFSV